VKRDVFLLKKKLIITLAALLIFISAVPAFATTSQGKQLMFQSPYMMQMAQKYPLMQKMMGTNPKMLEMMQLPAMQKMMQGPQMQELMKDPEIQKDMETGDMMNMMVNPKMQQACQTPEHQQAMNDPQVIEYMQKNGMGNMAEMMKDPNHMKDGNQMNGMMGSMGGMMGSGSK
jgi:hypothetical protein